MGLLDGWKASRAGRRLEPLIAQIRAADGGGRADTFCSSFPGVVHGAMIVVDKWTREGNHQQRSEMRELLYASMLREVQLYLGRKRAFQERNALIVEALCRALTDLPPEEYGPLQELIAADQKYPGIKPQHRYLWYIGKRFTEINHGSDALVPSEIAGKIAYYGEFRDGWWQIVDQLFWYWPGTQAISHRAATQ